MNQQSNMYPVKWPLWLAMNVVLFCAGCAGTTASAPPLPGPPGQTAIPSPYEQVSPGSNLPQRPVVRPMPMPHR